MKRLIPPAGKPMRHSGQTLVLMVLILPAFMGAMGLATDVANFYFNYVKVQTGADASVLSGVKYLPDQPAAAISAATTYATSFNGIKAAEIVSTTTSYDATLCPSPGSPPPAPVPGCKLTMNVKRIVPYYFGRLVGVSSGTMNVTATAEVGVPAASVNYGTVPIGVQYRSGSTSNSTQYSNGAAVTLIFTSPSTPGSSANDWSALALGGSQFTSVFPPGYAGTVSLKEAVRPDTSATGTGPVSEAIGERISAGQAADSSGNYASHSANDVRAVTVALVDWGASGGCCTISGFAQLWLVSVSNANISGYWIANGVNGWPSTTETAPSDGTLAISLAN